MFKVGQSVRVVSTAPELRRWNSRHGEVVAIHKNRRVHRTYPITAVFGVERGFFKASELELVPSEGEE